MNKAKEYVDILLKIKSSHFFENSVHSMTVYNKTSLYYIICFACIQLYCHKILLPIALCVHTRQALVSHNCIISNQPPQDKSTLIFCSDIRSGNNFLSPLAIILDFDL